MDVSCGGTCLIQPLVCIYKRRGRALNCLLDCLIVHLRPGGAVFMTQRPDAKTSAYADNILAVAQFCFEKLRKRYCGIAGQMGLLERR